MGVNVRATAMFREASMFTFCIHIIFLVLSEPLYLLALHDIFVFSTYAHRSALHDIYDFTAMPSFVAPRYLCFHRDALLLSLHDILLFARTSFDLTANTAAVWRGHRKYRRRNATKPCAMYWLENYAALSASTTSTVLYTEFAIYHDFMLECKYSFYFFHGFAFLFFHALYSAPLLVVALTLLFYGF